METHTRGGPDIGHDLEARLVDRLQSAVDEAARRSGGDPQKPFRLTAADVLKVGGLIFLCGAFYARQQLQADALSALRSDLSMAQSRVDAMAFEISALRGDNATTAAALRGELATTSQRAADAERRITRLER
jgi:hypothetical protein